jgi:hypothetical protein
MVSLEEQLAGLVTMSPAQLRAEWAKQHRSAPPNLTPDLLARSIAYTLQERVFGRMLSSRQRELERLGKRKAQGRGLRDHAQLKPGTRLAREWHGRTHHVLFLEEGFLYEDRRYQSLTAIAREITGAVWSGPRFFGLHRKSIDAGR